MGAIVVTGIPGVGKTTVMQKAAEGMNIEFVTYGTEMFEVAKSMGLVKDRDEMRRLSPDVQKEVQKKAAENIAAKGNVILDTHCTIKTPKGYLPGLPRWVLEKLRPSVILLVEADPKEIYGRRLKDETRNRDPDSEEEIAEHQMMNRAAAMAYASLSGATVKIVFNHDNRLDDAVRDAAPVLGN
ncbi:MAG: adenylate kinase [Thermoplasmata archaeon HGW-Thermoplasmata-1]|nr:MAG: adenylate kinase [Thermoplasmata archaeon HGW-Thermoplasmata-1]